MFNLKYELLNKDDALAISTGGLSIPVTQAREQRKEAQRNMERARKAELRMQNIKAMRERRQAARQALIARAQIQSRAVASGAEGSSSVATGMGSVQSQLASNLSFLNQSQQLANQQSVFQQKAANAQFKAGEWDTAFNLGTRAISLFGTGGA